MKGKVLWFNDHKGYGEIECSKGERFFFTYQDISGKEEYKSIPKEVEVNFKKGTDILFGSYRATSVSELAKKATRTSVRGKERNASQSNS